mgnify:FL=1
MKFDTNIKSCFVAGHKGMVGSSIIRLLVKKHPLIRVLTSNKSDLNLINQSQVNAFINKKKPDLVIIAAAKVGGIYKNLTYPAEFLYENLMIQNNIIHACYNNNIPKVLFLGSSCIYPRNSNQPIKECDLLTGSLEKTNEAYAIAKITGIKMCQFYNQQYGTNYKSLMPTNLYGQGDNYHPEESHVIPGLIRRFHDAKIHNIPQIKVWGTGTALREFLYVDDLADAAIKIAFYDSKKINTVFHKSNSFINVGSGEEISIAELALKIAKTVQYNGKISFDSNIPDGTPRKILDSSLINSIGWKPKISLDKGLRQTYDFFKSEVQ